MTDKKHLDFYFNCIANKKKMPRQGLCSCAIYDFIEDSILDLFIPDDSFDTLLTYWASGKNGDCEYEFTELRQTIVLFMAAINNEL